MMYVQLSMTYACVLSRRMLWAERLLAGAGVVRELAGSLSCPIYCGGSGWPFFLAGLGLGFALGLGAALLLILRFLPLISPAAAPSAVVPPSSSPSQPRRHRLSGYLHE